MKSPAGLRERAMRLCRESDPRPVIARLGRQLNMHPKHYAMEPTLPRPTPVSAMIGRRRRWSTP